MTPANQTIAPSVFLAGLALLAFVLAFYALIARERRTPYLTTNTVYWTAVLVLLAVLLGVSASALTQFSLPGASFVSNGAGLLLFLAVVHVIWRVLALKNSHIAFRTDNLFKNLLPVRRLRSLYRSLRAKPSYEHNPQELPDRLLDSLEQSAHVQTEQFKAALSLARATGSGRVFSMSAGYCVVSRADATAILVDLATRFLTNDCFVQYTTSSRHPIEFVQSLAATWNSLPDRKSDWGTTARNVVVVDAYTPHFGFTDTIHEEATKRVTHDGIHFVDSRPSFAGVHTANAEAFNLMKKHHGGKVRSAGLIIYEGVHGLVDLESEEQYRIFIRHVVPSERLWGGMFTVFIEFSPSDANASLLRAHLDIFQNLSEPSDSRLE